MPLIYGEGRENTFRRLREEINRALKGKLFSPIVKIDLGGRELLTKIRFKSDNFFITFSLSNVFKIKHFIAREEELTEIRRTFSGDSSCYIIILYSLGGISKT